MIQAGANITVTYDDAAGTITISAAEGEGGGGAVLAAAYNAHTILAATTDDNPQPINIAEQTLVGRITGGNITALTVSEILTLLNVTAGATPTNAANVETAGAVMKGSYDPYTILVENAGGTPVALTVDEDTLVGRLGGNNISSLTSTQARTLINVEDGATNNTEY